MKFETLQQLLEYDASLHTLIEPDSRFEMVFNRLKDCIETYKPHVIVKIGLGNPKYIEAIMQLSKALCVVVEPSLPLLQSFYATFGTQEWMNRLYTIAGNFNDFPIDYYKADMVVCIDCLDLLDTGRAIDEFRRALQFEGVFFLAGFVLPNEDLEGIFDEIVHAINPLHTDYYLEDDLKTFLTLNEFGLAKSHTEKIAVNLFLVSEYLRADTTVLKQLTEEHKELLQKLYNLQDDGTVALPYMISAYIRQKPSSDESI
ncbi:MAG: methyltransferase domain-containing protein [Spirochaetota bacterium]